MVDYARYYLMDKGNKSVEEASTISKHVEDKPLTGVLEE
jgi:hypothetical protein